MTESSTLNTLRKKLGGRNLYLVGMMGCGKSRTGPPLAKQLVYSFVDSDAVVEKLTGRTVSKIFQEDGQTKFRE